MLPTTLPLLGVPCPNPCPPPPPPPPPIAPRLPRHIVVPGPFSWGSATVVAFQRRSRSSLSPVMAAADYDRIPLETAGAYQLIDRESGEKFIVWGGVDDTESPIPPQEILSWKPPSQPNTTQRRRGAAGPSEVARKNSEEGVDMNVPTAEVRTNPVATSDGPFGSFGRLKAQKVKDLIKKSSQIVNGNSHGKRVSTVGDACTGDADYMRPVHPRRAKTNFGLPQDKSFKNCLLKDQENEGTSYFCSLIKKDVQASNQDVPMTKVITSTRGWGDVASAQSSRAGRLKQLRNMPADSGFFSRKSFRELGCTDDMIECLRSQMFVRPSHIQAMAYGPVLHGKSCIIADQSGSGKTLAYLAPVVQCLRQEEVQGLDKSASRSPRVIILVPTAELASQILSNCRSIAKHGVPFRSMLATGGFRQKTQVENLNQELDVLIATPGRFIYLLQEGFLQLTNLKRVILDEVDVLFNDEGFEQVLGSLVKFAPVSAQYLFVTATLPIEIYNKLVEMYPDCEVIMGPGMHRTSSRLEEVLIDCSGDDGQEKNPDTAFLNKKSALLQLVEESSVSKTIVFCNKIETCRKVENALKRFDRNGICLKVLPFHAALSQEIRISNIKEFLSPNSKESVFLVCTDRASRGMDFPKVDLVILFDFPRDPSEYVRRVGRTARGASGKGKAFIFVVGKQVSLARSITERNKKGHPLHDVPCAY